jgi:hypothetical protein
MCSKPANEILFNLGKSNYMIGSIVIAMLINRKRVLFVGVQDQHISLLHLIKSVGIIWCSEYFLHYLVDICFFQRKLLDQTLRPIPYEKKEQFWTALRSPLKQVLLVFNIASINQSTYPITVVHIHLSTSIIAHQFKIRFYLNNFKLG